MKKYVLLIPDGAADLNCQRGGTPLDVAFMPGMDFLAREGVCGLMTTLYCDLPRESMVAQLGMLGWDPHKHYPGGRASAELLAAHDLHIGERDLAFRANLVHIHESRLASYNAAYIKSSRARHLISKLNRQLSALFPEITVYHASDFRNILVFREACADPQHFSCIEPHENHGRLIDVSNLVFPANEAAKRVTRNLNKYLYEAARMLDHNFANALIPWSPSLRLTLPSFFDRRLDGPVAIVGFMDFLEGIAKASGIKFFRKGNGRPDTDYRGKGGKIIELLTSGYAFVICHINGPDEASHMKDLNSKINSLEQIDEFIVRPVLKYFTYYPDELGGVLVAPDHYSNIRISDEPEKRAESHSLNPVPFALWNNRDRDSCTRFTENDTGRARYSVPPLNHLQLRTLLFDGIASSQSS